MSAAGAGIDQGWRQFEAGNLAAARKIAERELRDDPEHPDVLVLLAACHRGQGEFEEALGLLERSARAAPEWSEPAQCMAEILGQELDRPAEEPAPGAEMPNFVVHSHPRRQNRTLSPHQP